MCRPVVTWIGPIRQALGSIHGNNSGFQIDVHFSHQSKKYLGHFIYKLGNGITQKEAVIPHAKESMSQIRECKTHLIY